jgi:hypothetical protein
LKSIKNQKLLFKNKTKIPIKNIFNREIFAINI